MPERPPVTSEIEPAAVWPAGAGQATVRLIDVRAPVEVARNELPDARNLPILTDEERHRVGACYHEHGHDAAIALGLSLTERHRQQRVAAWRAAAREHERPAAITCWRGGDRSRIAQEWLDGELPRVRGGAKALRRFLMAALDRRVTEARFVVVAGLTGSGKTEALHAVAAAAPAGVHVLDLEAFAEHRGSAFGGKGAPQPAQATFENRIAASLQLTDAPIVLVEDEARHVGRVLLPKELWQRIKRAPIALLDGPDDERVARIAAEYVFEPSAGEPRAVVKARLVGSIEKLHKRLGGAMTKALLQAIDAADDDARWGTVAAHDGWIRPLLVDYYDKHYRQELKRYPREVAYRGDIGGMVGWLAAHATA
ncbi:MAG: tRNA 2-selenouridine(34) synthase MnmH [Planctomycetes bacterium]|nr:tRNA 2-selenouridine(34) synthase MnmH [Planctomycetota bacterium]